VRLLEREKPEKGAKSKKEKQGGRTERSEEARK
jgi:hypothetical protein